LIDIVKLSEKQARWLAGLENHKKRRGGATEAIADTTREIKWAILKFSRVAGSNVYTTATGLRRRAQAGLTIKQRTRDDRFQAARNEGANV